MTIKWVLNPYSRSISLWGLVQSVVYIGWHFIFWLRVAFGPANPDFVTFRKVELILDFLFILNMILTFFVGIPYKDNKKSN